MNPYNLHFPQDNSRITRSESFHNHDAIESNKTNTFRALTLRIALVAFALWWLALMFLHFTTPTL